MILVPIVEAGTFWLLLSLPPYDTSDQILENTSSSYNLNSTVLFDRSDTLTFANVIEPIDNESSPIVGWRNKLMYVPSLLKYMIPLALVYFLEYFINQGLVRKARYTGTM